VLVNLEWEGREVWAHELLETHMFGSHVSGELVFQRADELLQGADDTDWDLAYIYLSAISLGFLGRYRGTSDDGSLKSLRRRLFTFVTRGRTTLADDIEPLFPEAVEHTLVSNENLRLPPVRRWATILAVLVAVYLVVAHVVWIDVSSGLREVSEQVARTTTSVRGSTP
jgi:type VI secretion system protein ImpK